MDEILECGIIDIIDYGFMDYGLWNHGPITESSRIRRSNSCWLITIGPLGYRQYHWIAVCW
jgi:hypothetical protein